MYELKKWFTNYKRLNLSLIVSLLAVFILNMATNGRSYGQYMIVLRIIYWLSFALFLASAYGILRTAKAENTYSEGGYLENWYDTTLGWKGTKWLTDVFDRLIENKIVPGCNITFVSPSGNKGVYEKKLFEHLTAKKIKCKFIVSDLSKLSLHENSVNTEFGEYVYLEGSNDAANISENIKKAGAEKVDVIFDCIGYLWHIKEKLWYKEKKCAEEMIKILEKYKSILNEGGLVILDNIKGSKSQNFLRQISHFMAHFKLGAKEQSTGGYIEEIEMRSDENTLKKYINENFEIYTFETPAKDKSMISTMVLRKNNK